MLFPFADPFDDEDMLLMPQFPSFNGPSRDLLQSTPDSRARCQGQQGLQLVIGLRSSGLGRIHSRSPGGHVDDRISWTPAPV